MSSAVRDLTCGRRSSQIKHNSTDVVRRQTNRRNLQRGNEGRGEGEVVLEGTGKEQGTKGEMKKTVGAFESFEPRPDKDYRMVVSIVRHNVESSIEHCHFSSETINSPAALKINISACLKCLVKSPWHIPGWDEPWRLVPRLPRHWSWVQTRRTQDCRHEQ